MLDLSVISNVYFYGKPHCLLYLIITLNRSIIYTLNKSVIISEIKNSNNLAKPNILMISAVYLVMNVYETQYLPMQTIAIVKKYFSFFLILIFTLIVMYKLSVHDLL